ncbi:MAG TPA: hypothetical protein VFU02_14815 [Polyangiaceae bacterium]|nr:hypothetical protein [Polyangiaceae bacterium]
MAWTLRALMGLSFGLGSLLLAGCDSSSEGDTSSGGSTNTSTTSGGTAEGTVIPFENGWAPAGENDFFIQGSFYTFKDNPEDADSGGIVGTSLIMPDSFADAGTQVCATGSAGQVIDKNFDDYWGAAIGFNLKQVEGEDAALPFDATATTPPITGFSFTIAGGNPLPEGGELRFNVKVAGDTNNYCAKISSAGNVSFRLTELLQSCWMPEQITPDPTKLEALHWQYVTKEAMTYDFDLCITELRALTD